MLMKLVAMIAVMEKNITIINSFLSGRDKVKGRIIMV